MSSLNKVQLIGRLGKDPEIRSFQSGDKVANFSIATSEKWKDKNTGEMNERTEWHNVSVFGALVGVIERFVQKGSQVYIEGQLQTRKWQDKDGNDRYTTEVVLRPYKGELVLLGGRGDSAPASSGSSTSGSTSGPAASDLDDDIPF